MAAEFANNCHASSACLALVDTALVVRRPGLDLSAATKLAGTSGRLHFTLLDIAFQAGVAELVTTSKTSSSHFTFVGISLVADAAFVPFRATEFANTCENSPSLFTFMNISLVVDATLL